MLRSRIIKIAIIESIFLLALIIALGTIVQAQKRNLPPPDLANIQYGEHERNVLDLWFAHKSNSSPLVIYIHGGGFKSGSKEKLKAKELLPLLESGISVAAINYRYVTMAPFPAPHHDARQALQFIRSKAGEWNIDKERIGVFGGSAGAQICMWLAFSDDMAMPESENPIKRESTRLKCVATTGGQTTNDINFWKEMIYRHAEREYGDEILRKTFGDEESNKRNRLKTYDAKTIEEANEIANRLSAISLISADDPPIFMRYQMAPDAKVPNNPKRLRGWLIHHVDLGIALKEKADKLNVETHLKYPGAETKYESLVAFFMDKLGK